MNNLTYKQKRNLLLSQLENDFGFSGQELLDPKNIIPPILRSRISILLGFLRESIYLKLFRNTIG